MKQQMVKKSGVKQDFPTIADKTVKVLANSIYQSLKSEGCKNKDIIGVSSQLIGLVADAIKKDQPS